MAKRIKYSDNSKDYIKWLSKKHGDLAIVSSKTVNRTAEVVKKSYKKELKKFILRNKFTLGAIKLYKSKPQRPSGEFRTIEKINAIVGVRKLKGGKEHYLAKQELGGTKKGHPQTLGKIPIPMDTARTSKNLRKPIMGALRLQRSTVQTLNVGPYKLGVNDPYSQSKRWAILYKGMRTGRYGWDKERQFFFEGKSGFGLFRYKSKKVTMVRTLGKSSERIKALHKFRKSVKKVNRNIINKIFIRNARRYLG